MNKELDITIKEPWFTLIKNKLKTVEGRLNKGRFSKLKVGMVVNWMTKMRNNTNKFKKVRTEIVEIKHYKSFEEMIIDKDINNVLPGFPSVNCGVKLYRKYYKKFMEDKFGVISITLKVLL